MKDSSHTCIGCGARVPPQDDDSTLISMKYGWRLAKRAGADGRDVHEWRCPTCWQEYREANPRQPRADKRG